MSIYNPMTEAQNWRFNSDGFPSDSPIKGQPTPSSVTLF
jgi:hypothetical protein